MIVNSIEDIEQLKPIYNEMEQDLNPNDPCTKTPSRLSVTLSAGRVKTQNRLLGQAIDGFSRYACVTNARHDDVRTKPLTSYLHSTISFPGRRTSISLLFKRNVTTKYCITSQRDIRLLLRGESCTVRLIDAHSNCTSRNTFPRSKYSKASRLYDLTLPVICVELHDARTVVVTH